MNEYQTMNIITPSAGTPINLTDLLSGLLACFRESPLLFKTDLKRFTGGNRCYFVNSGTTAIYVALKALKHLSGRKEVILPAYTAPSLILPIKKASLKPVLCDVSLETLNIDINRLSESITNNTLCVIPVHMFGMACKIDEIDNLTKQKGAYLLEDAASSLGSYLFDKTTGAFGDIGFYSFNRGKNLSTLSGGCLITNREDMARLIAGELEILPDTNIRTKLGIIIKTIALSLAVRPLFFTLLRRFISKFKHISLHADFTSFKYTSFQAGVGHSLFKRHNTIFQDRYEKGMFLYSLLRGIKGIRLPVILPDSRPVFNQFPLIIDEEEKRDVLFNEINRIGVECTILYPEPVHKAHDLGYDLSCDPFPIASYMARRLLLIPTHHFITKSRLKDVVEVIKLNCKL